MDECVGLRDWGGREGAGPIVLLHGLMGRGRTWRRQVPWLRRYGRVFTYDAAFHTGADAEEPCDGGELATERFVADLAEILTWMLQAGDFPIPGEPLDHGTITRGEHAADAAYRQRLQAWITEMWADKDRLIEQLQAARLAQPEAAVGVHGIRWEFAG